MTPLSQPGIINALDYGLVPNDTSAAYTNVTALANAIAAAQASCSPDSEYGGIVLIPSNDLVPSGSDNGDGAVYYFASILTSPLITIACKYRVMILGTGRATKLVVMTPNDFFEINNSGSSGASAGVSFQDLEIFYQTGVATGAAVRVIGGSQNIKMFRVVFNECPTAVALDDSLHCSIIDCLFWNENNPGNPVTLGTTSSGNIAKETYIAGCLLVANSPNNGVGTGLTLLNVDEVRVANVRIEAYAQGIAITPEVGYCVHLSFDDVVAIPNLLTSSTTGGAALLIQPSSTGSVTQAVFIGCVFGQTSNPSKYTGPGVYVDQSGSTGVVDDVRFVSCWSCAWPGNGLQINGSVTQAEIIGGCYSCNGQTLGASATGIAITDPASGSYAGVRVVGAACNNSVYDNEGGGHVASTQQIGVSIGTGAKNVSVRQCDLTGNINAGLNVTSPDATVQVTECPGYNDQAKILAIAPPPRIATISATLTYGYCGPMAFYVQGGTWGTGGVSIDGHPTNLTSGGFTLSPGENASLNYTTTPSFLAVGK